MDFIEEKTVKIDLSIDEQPKPFIMPKPFRHPVSICLSGTTGSGKTTWIYKFLQNLKDMFESGIYPKEVVYCYGVYQPIFDKMKNEFDFISFHKGLPSRQLLYNLTPPSMIILDDLSHKVCGDTEMELLFSQDSHHKGISVCFMKNNLFQQGKNARTISLNTNIYVLMKNPAGISQIQILGSRFLPKNKSHLLLDAYNYSIELNNNRGYLVVDLSPLPTIDCILKTNIFPGDDMILFKL